MGHKKVELEIKYNVEYESHSVRRSAIAISAL